VCLRSLAPASAAMQGKDKKISHEGEYRASGLVHRALAKSGKRGRHSGGFGSVAPLVEDFLLLRTVVVLGKLALVLNFG